MTAKNPRPLTRPRKGELNHGKYCAQPGSLPTTDLPCCENCPGPCPIWSGSFFADRVKREPECARFTSLVGCLSHPGARAYLNKDAIAELEKICHQPYDVLKGETDEPAALISRIEPVIALLRGDH